MSGWKAIFLITTFTIAAMIFLCGTVSASTVLTTKEYVTSDTFYPPSDVSKVTADICGGGSGASAGGYGYNPSASSSISAPGVGGDNATCLHIEDVPVTPGSTYPISVGAGGPSNASWYFSTTVNASKIYNASPGVSSSAFGYTANGGRGFVNNITVAYNTVSGWSYTIKGTNQGSNGYSTGAYAQSGGTAYGTCEEGNGMTGSSAGSGYGAGGGGGAQGTWETGGAACAGGYGGSGAPGYVKITYLTETSTTTAWYSQQLTQLTVVDNFGVPLKKINVTVNYIASSLPNTNASFLTDAFGVSNSVALLMTNSSVAMMGSTDSTGSLSFLMFPAITYGITLTNATQGVNNYVEIAPKDQYYTIKCQTTGQVAANNTVNASLSSKLLYYQLNTSYYNLSMIYRDIDGYTTNLLFQVIDRSDSDTVVYSHDWGNPGTNLIVDNYTVYCPLGQEYVWRWNATKTG